MRRRRLWRRFPAVRRRGREACGGLKGSTRRRSVEERRSSGSGGAAAAGGGGGGVDTQ